MWLDLLFVLSSHKRITAPKMILLQAQMFPWLTFSLDNLDVLCLAVEVSAAADTRPLYEV